MGFGKDGKGQILYESAINSGALGALASKDVIEFGGSYHEVLEEDFRILKCEYWMGTASAQAIVVADGPIIVGLSAANLQAADIEATFEAVPINRGDILLERTMRPVWPLEMFELFDPDIGVGYNQVVKGSFNPRWTFQNPDGWTWWIYNVSASALVSGSGLTIFAKFFGVWVS